MVDRFKKWLFVFVVCVVAVVGEALASDVRQPLLLPGKHTLFQRVLAKPDASLFAQPGGGERAAEVTPFSVFYVYARKQDEGEWLEVGSDRFGDVKGWMRADDAIEWNQGLTVAFRDPVDHDRVLLFKDAAALEKMVEKHDTAAYETLYRQAESGQLPPNSPVVAIQPKGYIDILKDFYLVPIRQHEDVYLGDEQAMLLQVATVPLRTSATKPATVAGGEAQAKAAAPAAGAEETAGDDDSAERAKEAESTTPKRFRSGVVFVIDSTQSMGPYIDRTREAVRKIYNTIAEAGLQGDVNFGLVAFRDNPSAVPQLDYLVKTFATLQEGRDAKGFFSKVDAIEPAPVSSRDFVEDTYAGVKTAIEDMDWDTLAARYVIVITDAGARPGHDSLAATKMTAESLNQLARDKGVAVAVLHLLTPMGADNHQEAKQQYMKLSHYPGVGSLYYGVETGDVDAFGRVLDALAAQITNQVREVAQETGQLKKPKAAPKHVVQKVTAKAPEVKDNPQLAELQSKVAKLGYALRMRYLQQHEDGKIPAVFDAWLLDRDFRNPERQTLDVRVLLTRDQLSDLHAVLQQVLETAEEGLLSPRNFLNDLKSLAATVARDPQELGETTRATGASGGNLADMGFMREYVEDLPYTGEVMSLSLEDWQEWPAKRQLAFIHRLQEKINYYQVLHDHTDLWVSLDGGPIDGDSVFPVALDMLP